MAIKLAPNAFDFPEGAAPATPDTGYVRLYAKADNLLYQKDDAGVETALGGGGTMSDFLLAGDTGTPETVADGNTVMVAGGAGIDTVVSATDTVTVAVDNTVIRTTGTQAIGAGLTITAPTIADFTNMAHDHTDADDGGQLTDAALAAAVGIAKGGTGQTTQTAAFDALSPTTTKGDIIVSNGTDNIRLPVGTDTHVLTADSAEASGVKWAVASGSGAPFIDSTAIIKGSADATKLLRLEVDGFTTATTRVLTPPNYDGTIATLAGVETFTNKTLDADGTGNVITNIGSSEVKAELITGMTADGTPDVTADYVMTYDASATALKKVLLQNLVNVTYDEYTFNDSVDWQTTSTSFVDIDATDMSVTITTTGKPVRVHFHGTFNSNATLNLHLDFTTDGTRHAGDDGILRHAVVTGNLTTVSFTRLVPSLSAGSHTFKMQWKVLSNTVTLYAGAGTAFADLHGQFWVEEIS